MQVGAAIPGAVSDAWRELCCSGVRAAALSCTALLWVQQLLSSALSLLGDTSVFRISPIPEERAAPHARIVA